MKWVSLYPWLMFIVAEFANGPDSNLFQVFSSKKTLRSIAQEVARDATCICRVRESRKCSSVLESAVSVDAAIRVVTMVDDSPYIGVFTPNSGFLNPYIGVKTPI